MPDAASCPGCGHTVPAVRAEGRVGVFPENIAGALAYVTFIPAMIFLLVEPYRRNRFVRFHSLQCLLLYLALFLVSAVLSLAARVLGLLPMVLLSVVVGLAAFVLLLVLVIKALQGETFKVPILGDLAEGQAATGA